LEERLPDLVTPWLIALLELHDIVGCEVVLPLDEDLSGFGVAFKWMDATQMIKEMTESQPGVAARRHGLLQVGTCLMGSGDPYFVATASSDDPALLRVPHDAVHGSDLDTQSIDIVYGRLSDFLVRGCQTR
jgi:hypothetical protein